LNYTPHGLLLNHLQTTLVIYLVGMSKKTEKPRKSEKNNRKNRTVKKNDENFEKTNRFGSVSVL
jgi:hypothetical protein